MIQNVLEEVVVGFLQDPVDVCQRTVNVERDQLLLPLSNMGVPHRLKQLRHVLHGND